MANDWIKMRVDLFTHPKVVRMASALKADTLRTVGGLMSVWSLFDAHSSDGTLEGYTPEIVDTHLRWDGFSAAMQAVGWLAFDPANGLSLPEFDTHNGQSAKRRAQDADRKREVRKVSADKADKKRTREEKRREEIKTTDADASGDKSPADQSPKDVVFGLGVPLLTAANVKESNARSFLAMQAKAHGDARLAEVLQRCALERPVEPVSWLQAQLGPIKTGAKAGKHAGFDLLDYHEGVTADGHLA